jgi:hypothetical protein
MRQWIVTEFDTSDIAHEASNRNKTSAKQRRTDQNLVTGMVDLRLANRQGSERDVHLGRSQDGNGDGQLPVGPSSDRNPGISSPSRDSMSA